MTTIQHQQLKIQLPPPYSDSAGSLISNMHFLLLRNLKRIWVSIAQPRPKGQTDSRFMPKTLPSLKKSLVSVQLEKHLSGELLGCLQCAVSSPHPSAPANGSFAPSTPPLHLQLLQNSFKDFHKHLHIQCLCSHFLKRLWGVGEKRNQAQLHFLTQTQSWKKSPLRGYYNRQGKIIFGLYIFVLEEPWCFAT